MTLTPELLQLYSTTKQHENRAGTFTGNRNGPYLDPGDSHWHLGSVHNTIQLGNQLNGMS